MFYCQVICKNYKHYPLTRLYFQPHASRDTDELQYKSLPSIGPVARSEWLSLLAWLPQYHGWNSNTIILFRILQIILVKSIWGSPIHAYVLKISSTLRIVNPLSFNTGACLHAQDLIIKFIQNHWNLLPYILISYSRRIRDICRVVTGLHVVKSTLISGSSFPDKMVSNAITFLFQHRARNWNIR